jgi:hypothetical protein
MRRRYHLPTDITVPDGLSAQDGRRLRATVVAAIRGAVRDAAPGETAPPPARPRPRPRERVAGTDRDSYAVPSYGKNGDRVGIPVVSPKSPHDPTNPHNTLTAQEMYLIWIDYWGSRRNRAHERSEKIKEGIWRRNPAAFSRNRDLFENGRRNALGPEYQAAVDERDACAFLASDEPDVLRWLNGRQLLGRPVTFEQLNAEALRVARSAAAARTYIYPFVIGMLAATFPPAGGIRPSVVDEMPASPRLPEPAPEAPPAVATPRAAPSASSGLSAWARAWAFRYGAERAMAGVDNAMPATRVAASSPATTEAGPSPALPRPSTTMPAPLRGADVENAPGPAPTAPAVRRFDLTVTPLGPDEAFAQISNELAIVPSAAPSGTGPAAAAADARAAGLTGPQGAPGTADLAVQRHADASDVRGAYGVSGAQVQSAHLGPTSFLRDVTGYSRGNAPTTLLPTFVHASFDQHWKNWAIARRRAGDTDVSVAELYAEMMVAVDRIPLLTQATRNTIAWAIHRELFYDLGLAPGDRLTLPYPNVPPSP